MVELKHFSRPELACPGSGKMQLAMGFGARLEELREKFGRPMHVNSCCRSTEYNKKVGGVAGSFHLCDHPTRRGGGTCAIDIACPDAQYQIELIRLAWKLGWSVGLYKGYLHLDRRSDYTRRSKVFFVGDPGGA